MRGWPHEPERHSLSARGIKSRAIPNPIASPKHYNQKYYKTMKLGERKFIGSGIEGVYDEEIIWVCRNYVNEMNKRSRRDALPGESIPKLKIKGIYLFGSRVTGFYKEDSDLDVYIWIEEKDITDNMVMDYASKLISMRKYDDVVTDESTGEDIKLDLQFRGIPPEKLGPMLPIYERGKR